jgi:dTDP-4-dehydrorhamnose 3,5-epimerase
VGQREATLEVVAVVTHADGTVREASIDGVYLMTPRLVSDERGWSARTVDLGWARDAGLETNFVELNQSRSHRAVLRGLHVRGGRGETKLVRCTRGAVVDFVVDTRPWSPTFRRVERVTLDDVEHNHLLLSPFVAHGFQVASDEADVCYLHSTPFEPGAELAIAWNDPTLALDWPIEPPIVSARDANAPTLDEIDLTAAFEHS